MKKTIKLTESDLKNIIQKVLNEQSENQNINPKNLKFGDQGEDVKELQQKLFDLGLLKTRKMIPTGNFGKLTDAALSKYLSKNNGTLGKNSEKLLKNTQELNKKSNDYLLFDGDSLSFIVDGQILKKWKAYSGRTKWNAFGNKKLLDMVNTVGQDKEQFMKIGDAGPIPVGNYTVSQIQKRTNGDAQSMLKGKTYSQLAPLMLKNPKHDWNSGTDSDLIAWGNYRCPITPDKGTKTFGRGSFYIHGGGIAGSIGCIDLLLNMDDFAITFRDWKNRTKNQVLKLLVKY